MDTHSLRVIGYFACFIFMVYVVLVIRKAKKSAKAKEESERKKQEEKEKKIREITDRQVRLGLGLVSALKKELDEKTGNRFIVGYLGENKGAKYFAIVLRDTKFHTAMWQVNISVAENIIEIIDEHNNTPSFSLEKFDEVQKMLCEKIRALS